MGKSKRQQPDNGPSAMRAGSAGGLALATAAAAAAFASGFAVATRCAAKGNGPMLARLCALQPSFAERDDATTGAPLRGRDGTDREDPWMHTTHPGMGREGFNWTQLSMSRTGNFAHGDIKRFTAAEVAEKGAMWVWHTTFARSIPCVVSGLAADVARDRQHWTHDDYRREWGGNRVVVAYSDHVNFNRGVEDATYGRLVQHPDRVQHTFSEFLDLLEHPVDGEHLAVQQSPSRDFAEFGLPALPPLLEDLVRYTLNARNFWAATPPKVSVLHYDWQDSVLLQVSGSKRFTIIDPARMQTAYPCVAYLAQLKRVAPGQFERVMTSRELDNFPLLNVTHPDLQRHPLFADSHPFTVTLEPGDALLLPAYWYHQVESFAPPGRLNIAVNYWFQGHSLATRLYRTLRENVFINCAPYRDCTF